jgi:hypothetical protein
LPADLATIKGSMKHDPNQLNAQNSARAMAGDFTYTGFLFVPNRGFLRILQGDVVAIDNLGGTNVGWPILVSADAIAHGSWTFT